LFDLENIKVLHIEPTTVCNAACPQCDRENALLYDKNKPCELSLNDIKKLVPKQLVRNLDKMFMCGNFGDPAAAKQCLEIYQYFKTENPNITLGLNTNGGIKNVNWWENLANVFTGMYDYVVFSIDGLEDTNHLYRKNVKWHKIIENAGAFIANGGVAHWDMLVYQHNQHQVDNAEQLAREMGFSWFRAKVSKRFNTIPVESLNPPDDWQLPNVANPDLIQCHALQEQSMFLAANGEFLPCCFIGSRVFNKDIVLENALNTVNFQGVSNSWQKNPLSVCSNTCGVVEDSHSSFHNQWQREVQLC